MTVTDRHVLALPRGEQQVFLAWRLRADDAPQAPFVVERRPAMGADWQAVSTTPLTDRTSFLDSTPAPGEYLYRVRLAGTDSLSEEVSVDSAAAATVIVRETPLPRDIEPARLVLADVENNGRLGPVISARRDDLIWILAYNQDGRLLWEHCTNLPARGCWDGSANHVPLLAWDMNADGRTEVVFHAFKGGVFPKDFYDLGVDEGEVMLALDAETGNEVWSSPWPARKCRVMMTVAHLDGPDAPAAVVVLDETYADVVLTAVDGQDGAHRWRVEQARGAGHNLDVADIDEDGRQEVICGGICYNSDGTIRWQAEPFGHTDLSKPARIRPDLPGLQIWYAVEKDNPGVYLVDQNGKTLFKRPYRHAHFGWLARHAPGVPGMHPHTAEDARAEYGAVGAGMREQEHNPIFLPDGSVWINLSEWQRKNFVPVHWAAGETVSFAIRKENKRIVQLQADGSIVDVPQSKLPEGGQYGRNLACVDVLGDYRENIVTFNHERHSIMLLANPNVTTSRGYSPWTDFTYRHDRSQLGSGYYIYISPPDTCV